MSLTTKLQHYRGQARVIGLSIVVCALLLTPTAAFAAPSWFDNSPSSGAPPTPRYGQDGTSAYDAANDRLMLFSGDINAALPRPSDVWVLSNATGIGGASSWTQLSPNGTPPTGVVNHSVVYAPTSNRLIVYGGCTGNCGLASNQVDVLTNANGTGGTPSWSNLAAPGLYSEGHSAVYDNANNKMIVFGGQQGFNLPTNSVRVLSNADGTGGSPTWTTLSPSGTPPAARESVGTAYDAPNNRMIVMGGATLAPGGVIAARYNDVWVLTYANGVGGTPAWTQLSPVGTPPSARLNHRTVYDPASNRLIVFGGSDATGTLNEVWVLTHANGLGGTPTWIQLSPPGPPGRRFGFVAGYNANYNAMVVAMGRTDTPSFALYNDAWVLRDANGSISLSDAHLWLGLKNSDDQGTRFDIRVELLKNGSSVASGLDRCVTGVTRNPASALEAVVGWDAFSPVTVETGDVLALRVSTRIGTNPDATKCSGHNSALGLRLYYDATSRDSAFDVTVPPAANADLHLRSDGNACTAVQSTGVTALSLNQTASSATAAKCRDSAGVSFAGGNPWKEIGTWSAPAQA